MDPSQNPTGLNSNLPAPAKAAPLADPSTHPVIAAAIPGAIPAASGPQVASSPHSPKVADDVDLIEKEWVVKAKAIVASTKNDPNQQTKDMSKFKADYLKTRYSKDIKLSDS